MSSSGGNVESTDAGPPLVEARALVQDAATLSSTTSALSALPSSGTGTDAAVGTESASTSVASSLPLITTPSTTSKDDSTHVLTLATPATPEISPSPTTPLAAASAATATASSSVATTDVDTDDDTTDAENDDDTDESESTDDIQDAMTKTSLCTLLFSLTRSNRIPINYVNTLSKVMCGSHKVLREFETLQKEMKGVEEEAAKKEAAMGNATTNALKQNQTSKPSSSPSSSGFFSNFLRSSKSSPSSSSSTPPVSPSPSSLVSPTKLARQHTDDVMWRFVQRKMDELIRKKNQQTLAIHPHNQTNQMSVSQLNNNYSTQDNTPHATKGFIGHYSNSTPNMLQHHPPLTPLGNHQHSSSTSLPATLHQPPSISTRRVDTSNLSPSFVPLPQQHHVQQPSSHASSSTTLGLGIMLPPSASSSSTPIATPVSPSPSLSHSSSFTHYVPGSASSSSSSPSTSGTTTPIAKYSPRRLWKTLFYTPNANAAGLQTSASASSAVSPSVPSVAPISSSPPVQIFSQQHFDSFPKLDEVLVDIVNAKVVWNGKRRWEESEREKMVGQEEPEEQKQNENDDDFNDNINDSDDSDDDDDSDEQLILHPSFPCTLHHHPFHRHLDTQSEQLVLGTWTDVLLNYRKHVPKCKSTQTKSTTASAATSETPRARAMVEWWRTVWRQVEEGGWKEDDEQNGVVVAPTTISSAVIPPHSPAILPPPSLTPHHSPSPLPSSLATQLAAAAAASSSSLTISSTTAVSIESHFFPTSFSPYHLRLLILLQHWLWLCPFDFVSDGNSNMESSTNECVEIVEHIVKSVNEDLHALSSSTTQPFSQHNNNQNDQNRFDYPELSSLIESILTSLHSPLKSSSLCTLSFLPSPLTILPYPFSDPIDSQYSSHLFTYTPLQLARELTLHAHQLFRKIPVWEWCDGAWQGQRKKNSSNKQQQQDESGDAYENEYSRMCQLQGGGSDTSSSSSSTTTHTHRFITDFNRLVYWIQTELLHPRLTSRSRSHLVLYFLELAMICLKVHRNFHVAFAVSAAFMAQPLYRLKEVQDLQSAKMEMMVYSNKNEGVQRVMQEELTNGNASAPASASSSHPAQHTHSRSVRTQYEELKAVTSSRNNYAAYRAIITNLIGEAHGPDDLLAAGGGHHHHHYHGRHRTHSQGSFSGASMMYSSGPSSASSSTASTPHRRRDSGSEFSRQTSVDLSRDASYQNIYSAASNGASVYPLEEGENIVLTSSSTSNPHSNTSSSSAEDGLPASILPESNVTLIPHLAVHLKDLTYSQELSGVEIQWVEEQTAVTTTSSSSSSSSIPPLTCRFDRSRWQRTSRLLCTLLRMQRLPIFSSLLSVHTPPLYTLLQVHLLTHVLPESELLKLSLEIAPRVDKTKVKQAAQQKQTLTALTEEGFI